MNPVFKAINTIMEGLLGAVGGMSKKTVESIRAGFIFFIFVLAILGGFLGYRSGMQNAKIKSSPLFDVTNDTFNIEVRRERKEGVFSSTLDSAVINEVKNIDPAKLNYPAQDDMLPEYDNAMVEPGRTMKFRPSPDTYRSESPHDADYRGEAKRLGPSSVNPLDKTLEPVEAEPRSMGVDRTGPVIPETNTPESVPMEQKKGLRPLDGQRGPGPRMIDKGAGVVE